MITTMYNQSGKAVCYIDEDGESIYLYDGKPVGWLDDNSLYSYSGAHLGWFIHGWVIDHSGKHVFFTDESSGGPARPARHARPARGARHARPARGARHARPGMSGRVSAWSELSNASFFDQ